MTGTDHLVVVVKDIDAAITNWQRLGCRLTHRASLEAVGIEQAFFKLQDGTFIELIAPGNDHSPLHKTIDKRGEGIHTIALNVEDIDQAVAALQANGVELQGVGTDQVFVHPRSSNGVRIQLWDQKRPHRWQQNPSEGEPEQTPDQDKSIQS